MTPLLRPATAADIPLILELIRGLAEYEKLLPECEATEERLSRTLFPNDGTAPGANVVIAEAEGIPAGFALYFFNYSTFLAKPGLTWRISLCAPSIVGAVSARHC